MASSLQTRGGSGKKTAAYDAAREMVSKDGICMVFNRRGTTRRTHKHEHKGACTATCGWSDRITGCQRQHGTVTPHSRLYGEVSKGAGLLPTKSSKLAGEREPYQQILSIGTHGSLLLPLLTSQCTVGRHHPAANKARSGAKATTLTETCDLRTFANPKNTARKKLSSQP